jgi:hypothetical protein
MSRLDPFAAGLTVGGLMGAVQAAWIALVAFTAAPWVSDIVVEGQVGGATFVLESVDLSVAAFLVVLSVFAGCATGWLFATVWNGLAHLRAPTPLPQVAR